MSSDRPIHVVLDTSAVVAYTRGSIHVGEVVAEVDDNGAVAGLPMSCLAAARWAADIDRIHLLVNHRATVVLTADPHEWQALANFHDVVGSLDGAAAVLDALHHDCQILTALPGRYGGLDDDDRIVALPG